MSEENKAIVRRYVEEAVKQRNMDVLEEIFAPEFVDYTAVPGRAPGLEGLKQFFTMMDAGFSNFRAVVEDVIAEGDRVAVRFTFHGTHQGGFMYIPPTGRRVTIPSIDILRVIGWQCRGAVGQRGHVGMMRQLGAVP